MSKDLKFYSAPKDEKGNPIWIPLVIKNKDALIGFIDGVNITDSIYDVDRDSIFYSLSSERFNDTTQSGKRMRDMTGAEFTKHAQSLIQNGFDRAAAMSADNCGLDDFILTISCSCGNFVGFSDTDSLPEKGMNCDLCGKVMIQYTNENDDAFVYDGISGRNNEAVFDVINSLEPVNEEEQDQPDDNGW